MVYIIEQDKNRIVFSTIAFDLIIAILILVLLNVNFNFIELIFQTTISQNIWLLIFAFTLIFLTSMDTFLKLKNTKKYKIQNNQIYEYKQNENTNVTNFNKQFSLSQSSIDKLFNDVNISFNNNYEIEAVKYDDNVKSLISTNNY